MGWKCIENVLLAALGSFVHIISVNGLECVGERCVSMHKHWTLGEINDDIYNGLAYSACKDWLFWCLPPLMCSLSYGRSDRKSWRSGINKPTNPLLKHEIPVPTEDYCQNGGTRLCQGWSQVRQQWLGCSRRRKALRDMVKGSRIPGSPPQNLKHLKFSYSFAPFKQTLRCPPCLKI